MRTISELLQGAPLIGDAMDRARPTGADKEAVTLGVEVARAIQDGAPRGLMVTALMELSSCQGSIPAFMHALEGELRAQLRKELH